MAEHSRNSGRKSKMNVDIELLRELAELLSETGLSEIEGEEMTQGLFLAVEVKRPGGTTSENQDWFLGQVTQLGGIALCVHSVTELEEGLEPYLAFGPAEG